MPRPGPRVAVVIKDGTPSYVRDGRLYEGGALGGDLDQAVAGNPEAEAHAKSYRNGMMGGFIASLTGAVCVGTGAGVLLADSANSFEDHASTAQVTGLVLIGAGIVASIVGGVLYQNAQPHLWDAINIYNDGFPDPMGPPRPPYAPYAAPPPAPQPPPAMQPNPAPQPGR